MRVYGDFTMSLHYRNLNKVGAIARDAGAMLLNKAKLGFRVGCRGSCYDEWGVLMDGWGLTQEDCAWGNCGTPGRCRRLNTMGE